MVNRAEIEILNEYLNDVRYRCIRDVFTDQPWPERLADTRFEAYDYGAYEKTIHENLDDLPYDFKLTTITVQQIMLIQQVLTSVLKQCDERTVFEIVGNVADNNNVRDAYNSDSKEIIIDIK